MKFSVYFLRSLKDNNFYIGYTSLSPQTRLAKYHNKGFVKSTKYRKPLILVYYEIYYFKHDAYKREFHLKNKNGYQEKLNIIKLINSTSQDKYPIVVGIPR